MRKIKITEEQRQYALKEGIVLNADVDAAGGDVKKAVDTTKQQAQKSGVDMNKATIQIPPTNESRVITKKQIYENRLNMIKENSDFYKLDEFMKRISGKRNVNEDFSNTQIRNMLGDYDNPELNAAADAESNEDLEHSIWQSVAELAGGDPRKKSFNFSNMVQMLKGEFGFNYTGYNPDREEHTFENGEYTLSVFPEVVYPQQGMMTLHNMQLY